MDIQINNSKISDKELAPDKRTISQKQGTRMETPIKNALEQHIDEVSQKIEITLEKHETTPGVGNCWYEACASLMRLNNMRNISAKQLRKEVVDNIENCENFKNVFEMIFESNYEKFSEFKKNITEKVNLLMKMEY